STGREDDYVDRLSAAVQEDPANAVAVERLIAVWRRGGAIGLRAQHILETLHFDAIPTPVHLLLGAAALERALPIVARRHFEEALRLDPESPEAANNLAWLLTHFEPLDVDRALTLVNPVIARFPNRPPVLQTRGHALAMLGRWQEACQDFETLQILQQDDPAVHEALAECYDHLDKAEQAEAQRRFAQKLIAAKAERSE
ncbi:MAG TPA: tetratricopeptide repeat protein, partial [Pirellulales bacterium]|nr:tetratricopeptide repeat protein [Pirellulales bacterium]